VVYICAAGWPTIGYGHVVRKGETFDEPITEEFACDMLDTDLDLMERAVERLTKIYLTSNQFDALVSFCYNLGWGAYQCSTLRQLLNRGEYVAAGEQFTRWVYAKVGGVLTKLPGLVKRRNSEKNLFLSDEVQDEEE
jgi:lysozyme